MALCPRVRIRGVPAIIGKSCSCLRALALLEDGGSQIPVRPRCPILDGLAAFDLQSHSEAIATWVASALTAEFGAVTTSRPSQVTIGLSMLPEQNPSCLTGIGCPHGTGDRRSLALMQGPQAREAVGGCVTLSGTSLKCVLFQTQSPSYFVIWDFVVGQEKWVTSEEESSAGDLGHKGGKRTPLSGRPRVSYYL